MSDTLKTVKLKNKEGNLQNPDGTSKIFNDWPPDFNNGLNPNSPYTQCNKVEGNPCPKKNADLIGYYNSGDLYKYQRCGCLSKDSWSCQPMKNKTGGDVQAISKNIDGYFPNSSNFYGCGQDPPNYAICSNDSRSYTENGIYPQCVYPSNAIPTDDQAKIFSDSLDNTITSDEKQLLFNYCFAPSTSTRCLSGLSTCPKALSFDGQATCIKLRNKYPLEYDEKSLEYCTNFYNNNKNNSSALKTSGCQCLIDTTINPNQTLQNLTTIPGLENTAKCVWFPCGDLQPQNFTLSKDRNSTCNKNIKCLNLINLGGNVVNDQGVLSQNIQCGQTDCSAPCASDEVCDKIYGKCIKKPTTSSPSTTKTPDIVKCVPNCKIYEKCIDNKCVINLPLIIGSLVSIFFLFIGILFLLLR
jgi:hypothetical protein